MEYVFTSNLFVCENDGTAVGLLARDKVFMDEQDKYRHHFLS